MNPFNVTVSYTIGFNEIVSSNRIKMFGIEKRKCRFPAEITSKRSYPLGFYTQNFCLIECNIKAAIQLCGCQPFFYTIGKIKYKNNYGSFKRIVDLISASILQCMGQSAMRPNCMSYFRNFIFS